jgi:anti-anti-sigma factor
VEESKILVACEQQEASVQIVGRGSFQNAHLLKSFYNELLTKGINGFYLDLKECTYLDSTFLGTLAGLGSKLRAKNGKLNIVNASTRNMELLQNLGLDRIFTIQISSVDFKPENLTPLQAPALDKTESGQQMLEAHQTLIQLDPRNVAKFKDVVAYLKEDLGLNNS